MSLRNRTFSAGRWTAGSAFARSGLQLLQVVVLARLLDPASFGLMALATGLIAIASLLADFGVSRAIIYYDDLDQPTLSTLFWLNLGLGLLMGLALAVCAPWIASLYHQPPLTHVLLAISPVLPLTAAGQQFCVLAEKELHFSTLAQNEIAAALLGCGVGIVSAYSGAGVYSLVIAALVTAAAGSLLAWWRLSGNHRPSFHFHPARVGSQLRMGSYLVGENATSTLIRQADVFVGGLVVPAAALGLFSLPRDLSLRLALVINPIVTRVGFPLMARLKNDRTSLRNVYLQTLRMTASVNFPLYVFLGAFAPDVVRLLYGPRWGGAAVLLRILAGWGLVRSIGNPVGSLLYAVGRARSALFWNLLQLGVLPVFYFLAARAGGVKGLSLSLLAGQLALLLPAWRFLVFPHCGMPLKEFALALLPPCVAALVAGTVSMLAAAAAEGVVPRLAIGGTVGALVYVGLSWWMNPIWVSSMRSLLKLERSPQ